MAQRGKLAFDPVQFDINFIIKDVLQLSLLSAQNKRIKLLNMIESQQIVFADPNLMKTIIRNLISNAIKFTPVDGEIEIGKVENKTDHTNSNTFYVRDSGVGMNQGVIDKLFRIDQNVTSKGTNEEKGTGLGLILCKEFIDKHNCRIWVESIVGKGSTFYFELPIPKADLSHLRNQE